MSEFQINTLCCEKFSEKIHVAYIASYAIRACGIDLIYFAENGKSYDFTYSRIPDVTRTNIADYLYDFNAIALGNFPTLFFLRNQIFCFYSANIYETSTVIIFHV